MAARRGGRTQAKRSGGMKMALVLGAGLLIGLGLAAAFFVFGDRERLDALLPQPDPNAEAAPSSREREPVAQEPADANRAPRPTFDFYTVLPEREVALPDQGTDGGTPPTAATPSTANAADASTAPGAATAAGASTAPGAATAADATSAPTATVASAGGLLQAGAFSNAGDAEALRAKLALLGRSARIETVQADGRTLHRVRLGPFASEAERAAAQAQLAEAGIKATPAR
ncbi:MAG TPA: hypothetical protein DCM32_10060 [Xanthomonadaceae bacterium]|jgi:cell division protein FtsN|nr:hypothetical protein [Xanthomonadaceae bacterium]